MKKPLLPLDGGSGSVPFLEEAINRDIASYGKEYEVSEVAETRKRTGYLLTCKDFQVFSYKSSGLIAPLLEFLEEAVNLDLAASLWLIPNNDTVDGFGLVLDEETLLRRWIYSKKQNVLHRYTTEAIRSESSGLGRKKK
jgi:hypothetical protein